MRVAMFMIWEGSSEEQYDQVRKVVDWDNKIPKGACPETCPTKFLT